MAEQGVPHQLPSRPQETSLGVTVIGVDPGESTGWAKFTDGKLAAFGTLSYEGGEFYDWLQDQVPNVWVVEDYIIQPKRYDHHMSKGIPMRIIGAIEYQACRGGSVISYQQASIKPGAYAHMGAQYVKGKKGMHYMDAIAHAHEYMLKHRMLRYEG